MSESQESSDDIRNIVDLIGSAELPEHYFNGFSVTLGAGDVVIALKRGERVVAILETSYTVAKTLSNSLGLLIAELERRTGNEIMTTHFIADKLRDASDDNQAN